MFFECNYSSFNYIHNGIGEIKASTDKFFITKIEYDKAIVVGVGFIVTFKQVFRSKSIKMNFGVKIISSNKTGVIKFSHIEDVYGEFVFHYVLMGALLR